MGRTHIEIVRRWKRSSSGKVKLAEQKKRREQKAKAFIWNYKLAHGCKNCGPKHPACLHFHHKNPVEKVKQISDAFRYWSIDRIKKEIEKCELMCANCHNELHWAERYPGIDPYEPTSESQKGNPCF